GRSLMDITVIGDMGAPGVRPPRDIYQYWEREYMYGINIDAEERDTILATFFNADFKAFQDQVLPGDFPTVIPTGQSPWFGDSYFRNDSILSAEFVGSPGTAVEIRGELDSADPKNTAEDLVDVYAFAVDGTRLVVLEGRSTTSG